jgi:predicted deacylase
MTLTRNSYKISGSPLSIDVFTIRGRKDGPVLGVTGSIHGDELEGPLALSSLISSIGKGDDIVGTLIIVPIANPAAVASGVRCTPADGGNLARTFPGRSDGTVTESIAALVNEHVLQKVTHFIDLHSAGATSASPLFTGYVATPETAAVAREMAVAFAAPVVWRHDPPVPPGRTLTVCAERNVPSIYLEATGGLNPPQDVIDAYRDGVLRVMAHLNMIAPMPPADVVPIFLSGDGNTDSPTCQAPERGLLECHVEPLQTVTADQLCFTLRDLDGSILNEVRPGVSGVITFVRKSRWAEKGSLLLSITVDDKLEAANG